MKNDLCKQLFQDHKPDKIIKALSPYLTDKRKLKIDKVIQARIHGITLALENPADINNALASVRTCEGLGVATIHIICAQHDARYVRPITQSAFYWVDIIFHNSLTEFINIIKQEKYLIAGAAVESNQSICELNINQPLCLLLGNEKEGLSEAAKNACDILFTIPMHGMVDSFNLSVAAAISLFDVTQRKRSQMKNKMDLSSQQEQNLRAKYYLNSVNTKMAKQLLTHNT